MSMNEVSMCLLFLSRVGKHLLKNNQMAEQWHMNSPIIEISSSSVSGLHYGLLFFKSQPVQQ